MADTTFVDGDLSQSNRVVAAWLNDVNEGTYGGTAGQVLTSAGSRALATWEDLATITTAAALQTATTEVDVAAAAAPTAGQVLTATSGTAATWQTPTTTTFNYINIRDYEDLVSGGSWTAAFNQALVDVATSDTRTIYFPYDVADNNGNYNFNTKPNVMGIGITLRGENSRQFLVRNYAPSGTAATAASSFLVWDGSGYVSDPNQNKGGGMVNLGVGAGNGTTLGTAILVTGTNTNSRPGYMDFRNVVISVPNGSTGTWQHGFFIQGQSVTTSGSQGMRDIFAYALYVFRCTDEPFRITNGVHISIHGLTISDGGAGNSNPTVRINGSGSGTSNSTQCFLNNLDIEGTLALTECSYIVAQGYANVISTTLTATSCKFIGIVNTNNATTGTTVI